MTARYLIGDVLAVLPTLEAGSVDLVLTSPPFLALRSYLPADHPDKAKEGGSQPTPGAFIDWLVDVVEALDRVLAPHGSMVIELGDTYSGSTADGGDNRGNERYPNGRSDMSGTREFIRPDKSGWPADKSLTLIPELFRMTLVYGFNPLTGRQTKRWRLRNVIRWVRPNPPVGALGDKFRPATSELMVFCRTDEAGRKRYFDLDAVREPHKDPSDASRPRIGVRNEVRHAVGLSSLSPATGSNPIGAPPLDWWNIPLLDGEEPTRMAPKERVDTTRHLRADNKLNGRPGDNDGLRNSPDNPMGAPPLDWWNIPPGGYQGAHYAVFPEALCVRPIKAMCPEKVCRTCGEPSRRIVETSYIGAKSGKPYEPHVWPSGMANGLAAHSNKKPDEGARTINETLGWSDCSHDNYRPGLVLDPFAGSGTTLAVAQGHGRDAIGIDLDERNARLAEERIGFFLEVVGSIT